ncbi:MAG: hypothetical protein RR494_13450 [Vagococcus sp.]|uniref:hypothetical protein n=1 Tax=Vagococcus sp. TaxID=1933889 RepID=UPI002FCBE29B
MAEIMQLKEDGVFKYLKTHFKAVEGLDVELAKKQDVIKDTGFVNLPITGASVSSVRMRRVGNLVKLSGSFTFKTSTGALLDFPLGFKPSQGSFSQTIVGQAQAVQTLALYITKNGISVIWNTSNATDFHLDSITFITDDAFPT